MPTKSGDERPCMNANASFVAALPRTEAIGRARPDGVEGAYARITYLSKYGAPLSVVPPADSSGPPESRYPCILTPLTEDCDGRGRSCDGEERSRASEKIY